MEFIVCEADIDISNFEEPVTVEGFYNLLESAIDSERIVLIVGMRKGDFILNPVFVIPTKDSSTGNITIKGFEAVVSSDDAISPIVESTEP